MAGSRVRFGLVWLGGLGLIAGLFLVLAWTGSLDHLTAPRIAVIEINGVISRSDSIVNQLAALVDDDDCRGVIVRINSPGGSIGPTQEIYRELIKFRDRKPVIASLGDVAASGGYYIAAAAGKIVANPGTVTGSIGVMLSLGNMAELLEKIGLESTPVTSGRYKDSGNPARRLRPDEEKLFQELVNEMKEQFVSAISAGRGIERAKASAVADGRVFSGRTALELGFVDKLGNFRDAVDLMKETAGLTNKPQLVYVNRTKRSVLADLTDNWLEDKMARLAAELAVVKPKFIYQW